MSENKRKYDDRRYISRGKFYMLHLDKALMKQGVEQLNKNKVGHPFVYSDACFMAMALFKNTIDIPYRQLQGIAEEILGEETSPKFPAIYKRINKLSLEDDINGNSWFCYDSKNKKTRIQVVFLSGDSTGLKPTSRGDWMGQKWDVKRGFIKMHIVVDENTKKIYAVSVTDERAGDAPEFKRLLSEALHNIRNSSSSSSSDMEKRSEESVSVDIDEDMTSANESFEECNKQNVTSINIRNSSSSSSSDMEKRSEESILVGFDGAYDSNEDFEECNKQNVTPIIPVRKNFSPHTEGSRLRREQGLLQLGNCAMTDEGIKMFDGLTEEQKKENQRQWKKKVGYGRRWSVEIAISTFKRTLGENISSRVWCNVVREIKFKVMIYNMMIDDALEQEV